MDPYTKEAREWLDTRYARTAADGVYVAHQPIYGFRAGHCEPWLAERYARTHAIMAEIARLEWSSLLDVGAAEGYKAALARSRFPDSHYVVTDLSPVACERAREIYDLQAVPCDVHALPFADDEFDVVVCSETLEHVTDLSQAVGELARVAARAVVITVPEESEEEVQATVEAGVPHGHINKLDRATFTRLGVAHGLETSVRPIVSPVTRLAGALVEGTPKPPIAGGGQARLVGVYNRASRVVSRALGARTEAALVAADRTFCRLFRAHDALIAVARAPGAEPARAGAPAISAREVIDFTVPLHRLGARA